MALYRIDGDVDALAAPVLVGAFDGWIDAAGAATSTANHLAQGGDTVVSFDSDILNDYRSRRPVLDAAYQTISSALAAGSGARDAAIPVGCSST